MRRTMVVVVVTLTGLGLVACGDDAEEARLTQAEFVKQGNAICEAGSERIDAAAEEAFGDATEENPPTEEAFTAFANDTGIPEIEKQLDGLAALAPPEDTEEKLDAALKEARSALEKVRADPAILVDDSDDSFEKANELIAATGLETCAE